MRISRIAFAIGEQEVIWCVRFIVILIMFLSMMCMCDYVYENTFVWMEACREENEVEKGSDVFIFW
jgi:hypothetical protein